MNNLKIIHWNSNAITKKINELQILVSNLKIDIILQNETHPNLIKISNYQIITYTGMIFQQSGVLLRTTERQYYYTAVLHTKNTSHFKKHAIYIGYNKNRDY